MFGIKHHFSFTDKPLESAQQLFKALCEGRSSEEIQKAAAHLEPQDLVYDAHYFKEYENGPLEVIPSYSSMAVACIRYGNLDIIKGITTRQDFFKKGPFNHHKEISTAHDNRNVANACLLEAAARCRIDILDVLSQAARQCVDDELKKVGEQKEEIPSWELFSVTVKSLLSIDASTARDLASWIAASRSNAKEDILKVSQWIMARLDKENTYNFYEPMLPFQQDLLIKACQDGNDSCIEVALNLGAVPTFSEAFNATKQGSCFAQSLCQSASEHFDAKIKSRYHFNHESSTPCIPAEIAESHFQLLDSIANGHYEYDYTENKKLRRELNWANYSDNKMRLLDLHINTINGFYDLKCNSPDELTLAKARIARVAKCMALIHPNPDESKNRIDACFPPQGPACSKELIFISRLGHPSLCESLSCADDAELVKFADEITRMAKTCYAAPPGQPQNKWKESNSRNTQAQGLNFEISFFNAYEWLTMHRPDSKAKTIFDQTIHHLELKQLYEKTVLQKTAIDPQTNRKTLRV